jgi:RNA polymerase sigma-54 factor
MAISTKLELRQGQSLVMTPQLQQAIKLLQLSALDLCAYVDAELERNPLLERSEGAEDGGPAESDTPADADAPETGASAGDDDWLDLNRDASPRTEESLDADLGNVFPDSETRDAGPSLDGGWASQRAGPASEDAANLEAYLAEERGLCEHLVEQLQLGVGDPVRRLIGRHLIDMVDEAGYLRGDLDDLAVRLGAPVALVEDTLSVLQTFDPCGVFARDLAECLRLQLKERDRCDPAMEALLANLPLLASRDAAALRRICGVDQEDLGEMIAEIRALNPKPGLTFGRVTVQPVVPDVSVRPRPDGSWLVELNSESLPRVLVNHAYYTTVSKGPVSRDDKSYLSDCLQTANWLVKSLDQRARTILKVAEEIVRQQDGFLSYGVQHLKPLVLKTVAEAIGMHESTVSRVTANKYMATPRGMFELKYFFTSAIPASGDGDAHSSEAVRHRIRILIDAERADAILSDDQIVAQLKAEGVDIARRTVAKYRDALRIPSSVERRRDKRAGLAFG